MRRFAYIIAILVNIPLFASVSFADSYTAFSFKIAREQFNKYYNNPKALNCAGITRPVALLYDTDNEDIILVGKKEAGQKPIHYDDWVVATRAILKNRQDPGVSIDRTKDTDVTKMQKVRFEGGLEDTQFGQDLLDADIILKRLGLGTQSAEIFGLRSYMDLSADDYKITGKQNKVLSRFWFHPEKSSSYVTARDGVVVVEEYRIGVKNEVTGSDDNCMQDHIAEKFAYDLHQNFSDIKLYFPELARLEQLYYLAALAQGLDASGISKSSLIPYWLNDYRINNITTPRDYPLEKNSIDIKDATISLSGGVSLDALVIDLQDGVADSIKKYVLSSRPDHQALSWDVNLVSLAWDEIYDPVKIDELKKAEKKRLSLGTSILREIKPINTSSYQSPGSNSFQHGGMKHFERQIQQRPLSNGLSSNSFNFKQYRPLMRSPSHNIGGVMLSGVASLAGSGPAKVDLSGGNFSFIVDGKNARLAPEAFRKFITALWTVYYSNQDPGISIDPIAPGVDKHLVRYIGKVVNTDLGRVMRDADYLMKKWSVGTERPDIRGFKNPDEYAARARKLYLAASRFWFVPENMRFKRSDDMLLFDDGRMTIQTEYLTDSAQKSADPANEKFANFFTEYYTDISEKYPVYKELFDYAKMVSLAKYLKEQGIPLFWFLMANKDLVITEDSPGTVDELVKGSDYFRDITISGGVNLDFDVEDQEHYVYDQTAVKAINEARSKLSSSTQSTTSMSYDRKTTKMGPDPFSFDLGKESYTVVPQHSLTSGKDRRGIRYQTDMALQGRGLQLTQQSLDILKADLVYRETMEEMEPVLKTMKKHNLDQEEIYALYQVKKKRAEKSVEGILGGLDKIKNKKYSDKNEFITALELSIGAEQTERLKYQISKVSYYSTNLELVRYFNPKKRSSGEFGNGWRLLVPYSIKSYGKTKTEFSNLIIPEKMALVNLLTGEEEILTFSTERYSNAGYVPEKLENSQVVGLFMMTDASYRLADKLGNEFWFNPRGCLTDMVFSKDHHIQYEYLDGFTDSFEKPPYSIEPPDKERVAFLNVTIPKRMKLKDHVHGVSEILTFSDKGKRAGYVPENVGKSRFKIMVLMSDASFRLIDRNGNETALTSSGRFEKMAVSDERPMVSAVSQGNHRIAFKYTIDNSGDVIIASASLSEGEKHESPIFMVKYEYDSEGRLADIKKINVKMAGNQNTQNITAFASNW
ncbi:MAG: hypothetical protein K8S00_05710 [Bacteroidales bacterium]|nr:hypothetical protein [Bacteroidales bacterium]